MDLLREGAMAMMPLQNNDVASLGKEYGRYYFALPPALEVGGKPSVIAIPMLYGLNADLRGEKLKAAWEFFSFQCGPEWNRTVARYMPITDTPKPCRLWTRNDLALRTIWQRCPRTGFA